MRRSVHVVLFHVWCVKRGEKIGVGDGEILYDVYGGWDGKFGVFVLF